jgi:hypothetical protein
MTKTNFDDVVSDWRGEDRPHLAGWTKGGKPIFRGTEAEWRARFIDSEEIKVEVERVVRILENAFDSV